MNKSFEMRAFIERGVALEPFDLNISAPASTGGCEEFYCMVHAPALLKRDTKIFGVDADHARELAIQFVKSMLGDARLVNQDHLPVKW